MPVDIYQRNTVKGGLKRRQHQLEILATASKQVNTVLDVRSIIRTLVASAMELVGATAGAAGLVRDGRMIFTEYNDQGELIPIDYAFEAGYGVPGLVMDTGQPYICNDVGKDAHIVEELRKKLGFYNLIDVPIFDPHGKLLGCFEIHNTADHRPFDQLDIHMLEALAASAAVALKNAQLLIDRERAESTIRESEERFRLLVEQAGEAFYLHDLEGEILDVNNIACVNLGYTREELLTKNMADIETAMPAKTLIKKWKQMVPGAPTTVEGISRRKDGTTAPMEVRARRFASNGQELVLALVRDITQRKLAEETADA